VFSDLPRYEEGLPAISQYLALNLGESPQSVSSFIKVIADIAEIAWEDLTEE
jgi:hypothetical protein